MEPYQEVVRSRKITLNVLSKFLARGRSRPSKKRARGEGWAVCRRSHISCPESMELSVRAPGVCFRTPQIYCPARLVIPSHRTHDQSVGLHRS